MQAVDKAVGVAEHAGGGGVAAGYDTIYAAADASAAADAAHVGTHVARAAACAAYAASASTNADAGHVAYAARLLFETATVDSPLTAQLRCIRRDFARLKRLAREQKWTDDTPVPPDVFGPLWPEGVEPYWAVEPPPAKPQAAVGE